MTLAKWDRRYSEPGYAYGTEPNDFLVASAKHLPENGSVLCLAEGEGRNSVFLARHGFKVTAVDASPVGIEKTCKLAEKYAVHVETVVADLNEFNFLPESYDAVISIFCHLLPPLRKKVHSLVVKSLKNNGVLLLEGYTPRQLQHGTGGPPDKQLLMDLPTIQQDFCKLDIIHGVECEREVWEGRLHRGTGAVVQLIGIKRAISR